VRTDVKSFFPTRAEVEAARAVLVFAHSEAVNAITGMAGRILARDDVPPMDAEAAQMWIQDRVDEITAEFEAVDGRLRIAVDRYERRTTAG